MEQKIKTVLIEIKVRFLKIHDNIKTSSRILGRGGGEDREGLPSVRNLNFFS